MKAVLPFFVLGLYFWQAASAAPPEPAEFQYQRALVARPAPGDEQTCAVLDASIFAHAAPALRDLRVYNGAQEIPYATTISAPSTPDDEAARIVNLGMEGKHIVFDLEMPPHPYTEVVLDLAARDFVATATVTGRDGASSPVALGSFSLFDLSSQRLGHSTTINLQESTFRTLHVALEATAAPFGSASPLTPASVHGAMVPPSREEQTIYTTVAETFTVANKNRQTLAVIELPRQVPVERVRFVLQPGFAGNFARDVKVRARASEKNSRSESADGEILRVRTNRFGREIHDERLALPFTIGANLQSPATVEVSIINGDDQPLPIAAVQLQMRQRRLCWQPTTAATPVLRYGAGDLAAPVYDYARLFSATAKTADAEMGPESLNPYFHQTVPKKPFLEQHPRLIWAAMLAVVAILGLVAFRSAKRLPGGSAR